MKRFILLNSIFINILLLSLIILLSGFIFYSVFQNNIFSWMNQGKYIEGFDTSGNIPVLGKIYNNSNGGILELTTAKRLSTGDILKTKEFQNIRDISRNNLTITTVSEKVALTQYPLSGLIDFSSTNIQENKDVSMIIFTKSMIPLIQIDVKGIINTSGTFNLTKQPLQTIYPGYYLLSSSAKRLNDISGKPITVASIDNNTLKLSAVPNQDFITPGNEMNYIIEENT